jgi:6-phosphogluconolactonase
MINDHLHIYNDKNALCKGFTHFVAGQVLLKKERAAIALSGGSTPKALFDYWACRKMAWSWSKLLLFWGDERCVPPCDAMSNYGMTKLHLFDHITIPQENIFRIIGENNPSIEALRYAELLSEQLTIRNGMPSFDLVMLGLGDDGHIVSIFPNQLNVWNEASNCVVATHPETGMKRVSITGRMVNNAQNVAFLVTGKNKAEKVRDIIRHREEYINKYPAARVCPISQEIHWFLDNEAASCL